MNIVQIHSGLGNQMFQYAFYLALKQHRPDTKIDASVYRYRPSHNGYELERIFNIHPLHASAAERDQMADVSKDWFSELRRAIGWTKHTTGQLLVEPNPANGWCPQLLEVDNCYLKGFWQTENYFSSVADQVRRDFRFCLPLSSAAQAYMQAITSENSVSVHIRRGDYLKKRRIDDFNVCSAAYYRRAVEYILERMPDAIFYVFSDEPAWGQAQHIFPHGTVYVSGHKGQNAYLDMQLMSACRHHIIANSSFSWWGAWLGQQQDTIVIAPNIWFRHNPRPDITPASWIRMDVD